MTENCLFCGIVAGTIPSTQVASNRAGDRLHGHQPGHRADTCWWSRGSTRPISGRPHAEDLTAATLLAQSLVSRVIERLDADGANLLSCIGADAWQSVFHTHLHVIPRYKDDPLQLPWHPTPGRHGRHQGHAAEAPCNTSAPS